MTDVGHRVEDMTRAIETALHDFQHPTPVQLSLHGAVGQGLIWITEPDGGSVGFHLNHPATGAELLVCVADLIQDQVFDQLPQAWGEARPPCPGHPHPAVAELVDGEAWWRCPRSRERVGRIGELA